MIDQKMMDDLGSAFPFSRLDCDIPRNCVTFVADVHPRVYSNFRLERCDSREDVAAKLLEWLSRDAYKSQHFAAEWRNAQVHKYHLDGINQFCGTTFTPEDMEEIYTYLGNGINHQKTLDFIRSGYDMEVLKNEK